jgi:hypothetical protein
MQEVITGYPRARDQLHQGMDDLDAYVFVNNVLYVQAFCVALKLLHTSSENLRKLKTWVFFSASFRALRTQLCARSCD